MISSIDLKQKFTAGLKSRYARGYSLIELGIVLGVITGLVVGVLFLAQSVTSKQRTTQTVQEITRVIAVAIEKTSYGSVASGADIAGLVESSGEVPGSRFADVPSTGTEKTMVNTNTGKRYLKFPGGVNMVIVGHNTGSFAVGVTGINKASCIAIAQALLQGKDAMSLFKYQTTAARIDTIAAAALASGIDSPVTIAGSSGCGTSGLTGLVAVYK